MGQDVTDQVGQQIREYISEELKSLVVFAPRKDEVIVPSHLPEGDYVLSFRWDSMGGNQVWNHWIGLTVVK